MFSINIKQIFSEITNVKDTNSKVGSKEVFGGLTKGLAFFLAFIMFMKHDTLYKTLVAID